MLTILNAVACFVVVWSALLSINAMTRDTSPLVRFGTLSVAGGAFSLMIEPLFTGQPPSVGTLMLTCGVASHCIHKRVKHDAADRV